MNQILKLTLIILSMTLLGYGIEKRGSLENESSPQNVAEIAKEKFLMETGGIIYKPSEGISLLILNMQNAVQQDIIDITSKLISRSSGIYIISKSRKTLQVDSNPKELLANKDTGALIIITSNKKDPALLIAPEDRWAQVNVYPLGIGVSKQLLEKRIKKEIWRGFAFLMGAANSHVPECVMQPVFSLDDLDNLIASECSPEPFNKFRHHAKKMGISSVQSTPVTYRQAVTQGWAPPPTNANQRAIWKEIKK